MTYFVGSEWRLSSPVGLWTVRCWQKDKNYVLVTWTLWCWHRETTNWTSDFYHTIK